MSRPSRYSRSGALGARDPEFEALDPRVMKAFSHELRQRILVACSERAASPSDLADEWTESRSGVAYHVRVLHELGALELVREERVRGSVKHYYRTAVTPMFDDRQWAQLPLAFRRRVDERLLGRIVEDIADAAGDSGFDDTETHISRTVLSLDAEAFEELTELLADLLRRALELDAESDERRTRGDADARIETELVMLHFLRQPRDDR